MQKCFDFRSDTVTKPTPEMRAAMAEAEVGDDVYGEDPTVNQLEEKAAALLGMEAGLFVSSGTMGNLVASLAACDRGDEIIMGTKGHTFLHEAGGVSALGGIVIHTIPNQEDGTLSPADIRGAMRFPGDVHEPISRMLIVENTQNACGGKALSVDYMNRAAETAAELELYFHIDGARIFNAAVAQSVPAAALVKQADSVTFCLSKGLCAPVGSVLCGSNTFIQRSRRMRKLLGGGMRQAGVLAAAGIVALDMMIDRLDEDHVRARNLAEGLADISGMHLTKGSPNTNMVFVKLEDRDTSNVLKGLREHGVLANDTNEAEIRLVTHHDIDDEAVERCVEAFRKVMQ